MSFQQRQDHLLAADAPGFFRIVQNAHLYVEWSIDLHMAS